RGAAGFRFRAFRALRGIDARPQRLEQVGGRLALLRRRSENILALALALNDGPQLRLVLVLVLRVVERGGEALDERPRHLELLLVDAGTPPGDDLVGGADLVREVHVLEGDDPVPDPQGAELLTIAEDIPRDGRQLGRLHRLDEERVDLFCSLGRSEVVGALEDDRVDLVVRDEVENLDRAIRLLLGRTEVRVGEVHELPVRALVGLHDLAGRDLLALFLADLAIADRRPVLLMDEMQLEIVLVDRAVHLHGRVHEPERDAPGPDRTWHAYSIPGSPRAANRKMHAMAAELTNPQVADQLALFAALLDLADTSPFAVRAYSRAAELVRSLPTPVAQLVRDGRIRELRGIGPGIESKLRELVTTGEIAELRDLQAELPPQLVSYGRLHGLSTKRISSIARALEITTVPELESAVAEGRL